MTNIEQVIFQKLAQARKDEDSVQERLTIILLGNFRTLQEQGLNDLELSFELPSINISLEAQVPPLAELVVLLHSGIISEQVPLKDLRTLPTDLDGASRSLSVHLGSLVRLFRQSRHLSQLAFADMLNYDQSLVSKIERGKRSPSYSFLSQVVQRFGLRDEEITSNE